MWKNKQDPDRPQMTIRRMRIASCISKATDTHLEYVILFAFLRKNDYRNALTVTLHLHCLSQNKPITQEVLNGQGSQWTF